jgi:hypothetical protein
MRPDEVKQTIRGKDKEKTDDAQQTNDVQEYEKTSKRPSVNDLPLKDERNAH